MLTYYDPSLRSLSGKHTGGIRGKEHYENGWGLRKGHRLVDIDKEDARHHQEINTTSTTHLSRWSLFRTAQKLLAASLGMLRE